MCKLAAFTTTVTEKFGDDEFTKTLLTYDISDTVKVIDGMLYRVVPTGLELITYTGDNTTVTVADGTVRIAAQAFAGSGVTYVILPSTLRSIGHKAFYKCEDLTMVSFASYNAPVLEEEYDYSYWMNPENLPATGKYQYQDALTGGVVTYYGLGIVPYFMWNATEAPNIIYYGANFVNYIGLVEDDIVMVRPANGVGYDSFIYGQYFTVAVDGGAAADQNTLAAIEAINNIPDNVTLAHRDLVIAAREAYNRITSDTQRGLVANYEKLRKAEQRISDLDYIQNEGNGDTDTDAPDNNVSATRDPQKVWIIILACALGVMTVFAAGITVLYIIKRKKA